MPSTARRSVKGLVDIARRHDLVVFADEIYEKIIFDDAVHHHAATSAGNDVLCLTFSGLSKAYRVCGYRAGWVMISGPKEIADRLPRGPDPGRQHADVRQRARPARHPDRAGRLPVDRGADRARRAVLRAEHARPPAAQRDPRRLARSSRTGALYCFPRLDPEVYPIEDDEAFVIDLLRAKKILVTHGTGFNWPEPDHFRLVTLPDVDVLEEAIGRIADFLATRR